VQQVVDVDRLAHNVEPRPGALSTPISPPWASMILRLM